MCNAWKIARSEKEMSLADWKNTVDGLIQAFSVRLFRIVGGEPFVYPGFKELIHHIKTRGCALTVVSNGTLIDRDMARFLVSEQVDRIRISVDGLQEIDDFYRGNGAFVRTIRGVHALLQEKKLLSISSPVIEIHPFVSKVNLGEMDKLLCLSKRLSAEFKFHYLRGAITEEAPRTKDPGFPFDSRKASVLSMQEKMDFEKRLSIFLPWQERFLHALYSRIRKLPVWIDCPRIAYHFLIDPWGYVFPCEHLYNYSYGNCRDENVEEIWTAQKRALLTHQIKKGNLQMCNLCGHRKFSPPTFLLGSHASKLNKLLMVEAVFGRN
jgi:radical SAM protein with 4Fe4S-binding SPASM domain